MSNNKLNIIHLANFNSTNIGNGALVSGLESTISEDFDREINWIREPWDDYTFQRLDFDQNFIDKVNAADGLIVGGAVTFNGRDYNIRTGTRFELPFDLWKKVEKPIVFYGLSYRNWEGQEYHHLEKLKKFVELSLANKNIVLSVRNDGTKKWMQNLLGLELPDVLEIPDSAVFVHAEVEDSYYPELRNDKRNIILSLNDEDAINRFGQKSKTGLPPMEARERAIEAYAHVVEYLAQNYSDLNFILCPHYFDDYKMISDLLEKVSPKVCHQRMVSTGLNRVKDTGYFYGRYKEADLAISMRVHSMSPSIGLGTPMVAFTTQDRMEDFMERIGLKESMVDAFDSNCKENLLRKVLFALENPQNIKNSFLTVRNNLREEVKVFHRRIQELF